MNRIIFYVTLTVLITHLPAYATIIHIPGQYSTIQEGIDVSTNGDTVLVQSGTYVENINFNGHNILLCSMFLPTGDSSYISTTIIDGDSSGSVVEFSNNEDSMATIIGFTLRNGFAEQGGGVFCTGSNPTISNNKITHNYAGHGQGGGIHCAANSNPSINNNLIADNYRQGIHCAISNPAITGNTISRNSSGINCDEGSPLIFSNTISENSNNGIGCYKFDSLIDNNTIYANGGYGIHCWDSSPITAPIISNNTIYRNSRGGILCDDCNCIITNNVIRENEAERNGGGIYCNSPNSIIIYNSICANSSGFWGGGIYLIGRDALISQNAINGNHSAVGSGIFLTQSNAQLNNNIITGNVAETIGGGIYLISSSPMLNNNVITENYATLGGGIYCVASDPVITNSVFWENNAENHREIYVHSGSLSITYSDIQGGWEGEGNIDIDPLFRDPENGDFHLQDSIDCGDPHYSPCIDAGDPAFIDSLLDCDWGLGIQRSDMGAYGGGDSFIVSIPESENDAPFWYSDIGNYPNPFNSSTSIHYNLAIASEVRIEIYNLLGQRIETLLNSEQSPGEHSVRWDASGMASGIYFYKLTSGDQTFCRKMILLK